MSFKRILVAIAYGGYYRTIALSPLDEKITQEAIDLASSQQASLLFIHCVTDLSVMAMIPPNVTSSQPGLTNTIGANVTPTVNIEVLEEADRNNQHQAQLELQKYSNLAKDEGVSSEYKCVEAFEDIGSQICELAKQWNADLIVVGRRGNKGVVELLLGSVSKYILNNSDCAVLTVQ